MKYSLLGAIFSGSVLVTTADAATLLASVNQSEGGIEQFNGELNNSVSLSASGTEGFASTNGRLIVNPLTGVLASEVFSELTSDPTGNKFAGEARSRNAINITESFIATGSGTATFNFAFDGGLAVGGTSSNANVRAKLQASRFNPTLESVSDEAFYLSERDDDGNLQNSVDGVPTVPSSSLSIDDLITVSIGANDGQRINLLLSFNIGTAVNPASQGGKASSDFFNTGYLSLNTSDGLTLTPLDPLFLSQAGSVAPGSEVPVPAAGWLLLSGLGALFSRRQLASADRSSATQSL